MEQYPPQLNDAFQAATANQARQERRASQEAGKAADAELEQTIEQQEFQDARNLTMQLAGYVSGRLKQQGFSPDIDLTYIDRTHTPKRPFSKELVENVKVDSLSPVGAGWLVDTGIATNNDRGQKKNMALLRSDGSLVNIMSRRLDVVQTTPSQGRPHYTIHMERHFTNKNKGMVRKITADTAEDYGGDTPRRLTIQDRISKEKKLQAALADVLIKRGISGPNQTTPEAAAATAWKPTEFEGHIANYLTRARVITQKDNLETKKRHIDQFTEAHENMLKLVAGEFRTDGLNRPLRSVNRDDITQFIAQGLNLHQNIAYKAGFRTPEQLNAMTPSQRLGIDRKAMGEAQQLTELHVLMLQIQGILEPQQQPRNSVKVIANKDEIYSLGNKLPQPKSVEEQITEAQAQAAAEMQGQAPKEKTTEQKLAEALLKGMPDPQAKPAQQGTKPQSTETKKPASLEYVGGFDEAALKALNDLYRAEIGKRIAAERTKLNLADDAKLPGTEFTAVSNNLVNELITNTMGDKIKDEDRRKLAHDMYVYSQKNPQQKSTAPSK